MIAIKSEQDRTRAGFASLETCHLILRVFVPFTAAYYLSYLFRTINALISSELSSELALDAAHLGFLTSVYFLTFAAVQLPVGVWLDRYGPRRVQAVLLLFAAAGAVLFAMSKGFAALVLGRALIGVGVAAALTGGLKAIIQWFPKDRIAVMNGSMVALGALGALSATAPARVLLDWSGGWRGLFAILAAATVASALLIWVVVPEVASAKQPSSGRLPVSLKTIYCDPRFWGLAPLSATCVGTAWALQGLWAAPWLTDVDGLGQADVTRHLFAMAVALSAGALLLGTAADRLRRRGIGPQAVLGLMAVLSIAAQLALILRLPLPSYLPWSIIAATGAGTVLSYAVLAEYFPSEIAGRANGALKPFPSRGRLRAAIRDRRDHCQMAEPGWALSHNRLSDRIRPQSMPAIRSADLVCDLPDTNPRIHARPGLSSQGICACPNDPCLQHALPPSGDGLG